jgi:3-deoxy-manno-octulosonate cytidylyltransferase (CMP-KDO synthetase)
MRIIGIIPARMGSSRFPGKPMKNICGIPMVGHVYLRSKMSKTLDEVYVATCDQEIFDYISSTGGTAIMTKNTHERCGDRVAEALLKVESQTKQRTDIVVLIQGDEPLTHPNMIDEAVGPLLLDKTLLITNLMGNITNEEDWKDPNEVKVVVDKENFALYFSREPIPSNKKWKGEIPMKKQICIIPHRRDFMLKFNELEPTQLETIESVDMMRVLEHGYKIKMVQTSHDVCSVDTPDDLAYVETIMRKDPLFMKYQPKVL